MGVDITQYLFIGVKLDYRTYNDKLYTDEVYDNDGKINDYISIISDGMNGNYIYLGHIISECDEYDYLEELYDGFNVLKTKYKKHYKKVEKEIASYLNEGETSKVDIFYIKHFH